MPANNTEIEKRLWDAADELRANSKLRSQEYSTPVLGLIFLRYAGQRFAEAQAELAGRGSARRPITRADYQVRGVMYLPGPARWSNLVALPEGADIGRGLNNATRAIEADNEQLREVLPRNNSRPNRSDTSFDDERFRFRPGTLEVKSALGDAERDGSP